MAWWSTQEYPVARKLQEEARLVEQEYIAEVSGSLDAEGLAWLRRGLPYDGRPASPMQVSWQNETRLRFALKTPAPGFIEYACDAAGWNCGPCAASASAACRSPGCPPANGARAWTTSASEADAIRRAADNSRSTPDRCRTIPSRQRAEVFSNRPACSAGRADPGRLRDPAHRRAALVRRHASGHARAGRARAAAARRPRGHRRARVGRAERRGRCRRLAAVARLSTAHHAGRPQPPGHAFRLSGRHGRGSARPTCTRPSLPPISMPSGACRAVSAPGACWTCWTTNCCAATPSPSLAIATSRRCIWPSSAMRAS